MGEVKKQTVSEGVAVTSPTDISIDASNTAVSNQTGPGQLTITDVDNIRDVLVTAGSTTFDFVDGDVNTGTDRITENTHGMVEGDVIRLTTTGTLPTGLELQTTYFVRNPNVNDFQLSETPDGSIVDITAAAGGGTHTATRGFAVYLPTAGDNSGRRIRTTKIDTGSAFAEIAAESGETIFGSRSSTLITHNDSHDVASDGSANWDGMRSAKARVITNAASGNSSITSTTDVVKQTFQPGAGVWLVNVLAYQASTGDNTAEYKVKVNGVTKTDANEPFARSEAVANQLGLPFSCSVAVEVTDPSHLIEVTVNKQLGSNFTSNVWAQIALLSDVGDVT